MASSASIQPGRRPVSWAWQGMINDMIDALRISIPTAQSENRFTGDDLRPRRRGAASRLPASITALEQGKADSKILAECGQRAVRRGRHGQDTCGRHHRHGRFAGKSSLTDELIRRFRLDQGDELQDRRDPGDRSRRKRKSGGALLGDRIRMNAIAPWSDGQEHLSSGRSPRANSAPRSARPCPISCSQAVEACRTAGFDLVDRRDAPASARATPPSCRPGRPVRVYVMTPEFGAASQLEKIDMLDFADLVAINKFDRKGAEDALRDVARKQVQRNREAFMPFVPDKMPVFGTIASRFAGRRRHGALPVDAARSCWRIKNYGLPHEGPLPRGPDTPQHAPGNRRRANRIAPALSGRNRRHGARLPPEVGWNSGAKSARETSAAARGGQT